MGLAAGLELAAYDNFGYSASWAAASASGITVLFRPTIRTSNERATSEREHPSHHCAFRAVLVLGVCRELVSDSYPIQTGDDL